MRRKALLGFGVGVIAALTFAVSAFAANPHFISASATGPNDDGSLTVSFKIAGLGDTVTTTVTAAAASSTAVYGCLNNGGEFPNAANKQQLSGPVSASGQFTSGKNGQITDSLSLGPLASTLVCPPGQTRVLCSVSYAGVSVSEPSAGTRAIPGSFSRVYFPACL